MKLAVLCARIFAAQIGFTPTGELNNAKMESRARQLAQELRCLVCEDESIDASPAPLAADLRHLLRERILAGDSDQSIRNLFVARYGEFVLFRPSFRVRNWILWTAPFVALALAAWFLILRSSRQRKREDRAATVSAEETEELQRLLGSPAKPVDGS